MKAATRFGAGTRLDALAVAPADERKAALEPVADSLAPFLTDAERSVRLTVAKLFAGVTADAPATVADTAGAPVARLDDEDTRAGRHAPRHQYERR